mmetsp:Transcript_29186/g.85312  ORF Transcript_29186/g.85312 Transcript_29186/m.85312 type:complete len:328 (-) Transcript_29186:514-1497(-)
MDRPLAAAAAAAAIATAAMRVGVEVGAAAVLVHAVGALIAAAAARIARIDEQALVDQVCLGREEGVDRKGRHEREQADVDDEEEGEHVEQSAVACRHDERVHHQVPVLHRAHLEEHKGGARQARKRLVAPGHELDRVVLVTQRRRGRKVDFVESLHADDGKDERDEHHRERHVEKLRHDKRQQPPDYAQPARADEQEHADSRLPHEAARAWRCERAGEVTRPVGGGACRRDAQAAAVEPRSVRSPPAAVEQQQRQRRRMQRKEDAPIRLRLPLPTRAEGDGRDGQQQQAEPLGEGRQQHVLHLLLGVAELDRHVGVDAQELRRTQAE